MRLLPIVALVFLIGIVVLFFVNQPAPVPVNDKLLATVHYSCNAGKTIIAAYYMHEATSTPVAGQPPVPTGSVLVTLSDGRIMSLPQTLSADGARYANADESFVFWNKGNGALVLEQNKEKSYIGCIAAAPSQTLSRVYTNNGAGFSIRLPERYIVDEFYHYQLAPGKVIPGIKFNIATDTASGTNLGPDTYISVEQIPAVATCSADLFLDQASTRIITNGSTRYSVASSTGAGAGNRYEETVYALIGSSPCTAVRYFIHYGVIENYPTGTVRAFDKTALLAEFDAIRKSLTLVQ